MRLAFLFLEQVTFSFSTSRISPDKYDALPFSSTSPILLYRLAMNTEMEKPAPPNPSADGRNSLPLTILAIGVTTVAIILALVFAYTRFWTVPKDAATDTAKSITQSIREAFNFTPKVTINNTVFVEESLPILELATVSRSTTVSYSYTNQWAGSTKILILKG